MDLGELPDLKSPEFAPIRGQLARAFLEHKDDLGPKAAAASDQDILDRVDDIAAVLLRSTARALAAGNAAWLMRYRWFIELVGAFEEDAPCNSSTVNGVARDRC